jgi:hypothetical protein
MKQYKHPTVPMHLKKNTIPMNKVFTLAVMLFATAFLSFKTTDAQAQCTNPTKGKFVSIVSITNQVSEIKPELCLYGYKEQSAAALPLYYEWRAFSENGKVLANGEISNFFNGEIDDTINGKIADLAPGNYFLITYDSSTPCKKSIRTFDVQ